MSATDTALASYTRWNNFARRLAQTYSNAQRQVSRIGVEQNPDDQAISNIYATRNLTLIAAESLSLACEFWKAELSNELDPVLPRYESGRWREVLDSTHPGRPYHPSLSLPADLAERIRQTKAALEEQHLETGSASPNDSNPLKRSFAQLTLQADKIAASHVSPHESLGVLAAVCDLMKTAVEQPNALPSDRVLLDKLNKSHAQFSAEYIASLADLLEPPTELSRTPEELAKYAEAMAQCYQSIGLLRNHERAVLQPPATKEGEDRFLTRVSKQWEFYHLCIKPLCLLNALVRRPQAELNEFADNVNRAVTRLKELGPVNGHAPFATVIQASISPFLAQITSAREYAPFLQRHRNLIESGAKIGISSALAATLLLSAKAAIPSALIISQLDRLRPIKERILQIYPEASGFLNRKRMQEMLSSELPQEFKKHALEYLSRYTSKLSTRLTNYFTATRAVLAKKTTPQGNLLASSEESLVRQFGNASSQLADFAWKNFKHDPQRQRFLKRHGRTLAEAINFLNLAEHLTIRIRAIAGFRAQNPNDVRVDETRALVDRYARYSQEENALSKTMGFIPTHASPQERYYRQRLNLLSRLIEDTRTDAEANRTTVHGDRSIAHILVRYDPSIINTQLFDLLGLEDQEARSFTGPNRDRLPGISVGRMVHNGLLPTYHCRESVIRLLFPDDSTTRIDSNRANREFANEVLELTRTPGMCQLIYTEISHKPVKNSPTTPIIEEDSKPLLS